MKIPTASINVSFPLHRHCLPSLLTTELQSTNVFIIHGLTKTRGREAEGELTTPATYLIMTISDITPRQQWLLVDNTAASGPTLYTQITFN